MKKALLSFFTISFIIGGFVLLINPVMAETIDEGCLANQNYSTTTGYVCTRDMQVTGFLTEAGPSNSMWGTHKITNDGYAVCVTTPCPSASLSYSISAGGSPSVLADLIKYENSKVKIVGKLVWVELNSGFWGIVATKVIPVNTSEEMIKVLSPNGGESMTIGQKYNIRWDSNNITQNSHINIYLKYYDITCGPAPMVGCQTQFYIDTVRNTGIYLWDTSKKMSGASTGPNSVSVAAGSKYVIVLSSSSGLKDESDNYFTTFMNSNLINRTLRIGHKGEDVKNLQTFIGATVDGSFGPMTKKKVIEWQKANGLNSDGVFGKMSRQKAGFED